MGNLQDIIRAELTALFQEDGTPIPQMDDDLVLLDSGLDSLGFAVLVTRLEHALGYDPFSLAEEPFYPVTLGDFVAFYEREAPPK